MLPTHPIRNPPFTGPTLRKQEMASTPTVRAMTNAQERAAQDDIR
jgi:hypothetical protein